MHQNIQMFSSRVVIAVAAMVTLGVAAPSSAFADTAAGSEVVDSLETATEETEESAQDAAERAEDAADTAQEAAEEAADSAEEAAERAKEEADKADKAAEERARRAADATVPLQSTTRDRSETANVLKSDIDLKWRIQPLGLEFAPRVYNEHQYWRSNASMLFSEVFVRAGLAANITPAYAEAGIDVEFQPIRIFKLRAQYLAGYHFGTFKYVIPYDNPNPITRDRELKRDKDLARSGLHQRVIIQPTIQMAVGRIAVLNTFTYQYLHYRSKDFQGPWLRVGQEDRIIHTDGDSLLQNMLLVAYKVWDGPGSAQVLVGPFHEWVRGVRAYKAQGLEQRHRLGVTAVVVPSASWGKLYNPRMIVQAGYNVVDRDNGRANRGFIQGSFGFSLKKQ